MTDYKGWKWVLVKYLHGHPMEQAAKIANVGLEKIYVERRIDEYFANECNKAEAYRRAKGANNTKY